MKKIEADFTETKFQVCSRLSSVFGGSHLLNILDICKDNKLNICAYLNHANAAIELFDFEGSLKSVLMWEIKTILWI